MAYPANTADVISFLLPAATDYEVRSSNAVVSVAWSDVLTEPTEQEIIDAGNDLTLVNGQTFSQWKAENGGDPTLTNRKRSKNEGIDGDTALSVAQRAEMGERNKRDNYIITRLIELQDTLASIKASSGPADNIRAAIPASFSATATKARADARQDLRDEIDSGGSDT